MADHCKHHTKQSKPYNEHCVIKIKRSDVIILYNMASNFVVKVVLQFMEWGFVVHSMA